MSRSVAILALVWLTAACGQLNQDASRRGGAKEDPGAWGHLIGSTDQWLAQLGPGQKVSICGAFADDAESGIRAWAEAFTRGELNVDATCNRQADRVVVISDTTSPAVKRECGKQPKAAGMAIVEIGAIMLCSAESDIRIVLHEAGHLWGLCDVYPLSDGFFDNCDPAHMHGARSRDSVMGASYSFNLQDADYSGADSMSERTDIAGNDLWPKDEPMPAPASLLVGMTHAAPIAVSNPRDAHSDVLRFEDAPPDLINELLSF